MIDLLSLATVEGPELSVAPPAATGAVAPGAEFAGLLELLLPEAQAITNARAAARTEDSPAPASPKSDDEADEPDEPAASPAFPVFPVLFEPESEVRKDRCAIEDAPVQEWPHASPEQPAEELDPTAPTRPVEAARPGLPLQTAEKIQPEEAVPPAPQVRRVETIGPAEAIAPRQEARPAQETRPVSDPEASAFAIGTEEVEADSPDRPRETAAPRFRAPEDVVRSESPDLPVPEARRIPRPDVAMTDAKELRPETACARPPVAEMPVAQAPDAETPDARAVTAEPAEAETPEARPREAVEEAQPPAFTFVQPQAPPAKAETGQTPVPAPQESPLPATDRVGSEPVKHARVETFPAAAAELEPLPPAQPDRTVARLATSERSPAAHVAPSRERVAPMPPGADLAFALRLADRPARTQERRRAPESIRAEGSAEPPKRDAPQSLLEPAVTRRIEPAAIEQQSARPRLAAKAPTAEPRRLEMPESVWSLGGTVQGAAQPIPNAAPAKPQAPLAPPSAEPAPIEPPAAPPTQPVREISLELGGNSPAERRASRVELRLQERAGEVTVAVRAAEPGLTRSLREGLGELVSRLEQTGFRTDAWHPGETAGGSLAGDRRDSREMQDQDPSGGRQHGSSGGESRENRRGRDESRPEWIESLEGSLPSQADFRSILG